jgi:hypothetical protein
VECHELSQFFVKERAEFFNREHERIFRFKGKIERFEDHQRYLSERK